MAVKVAIDTRRVNDFGVGTYIRNIVHALAQMNSGDEFFLLGQSDPYQEFANLPSNFRQVAFPYDEHSPRSLVELNRTVKRLQCDLLHVPHLFWYPRRAPCPYIVTVHDLLNYFYPANNHSELKRLLHNFLTRRALERSARILAVSKFTRNDIVRIYRIRPAKIEVVYNAI